MTPTIKNTQLKFQLFKDFRLLTRCQVFNISGFDIDELPPPLIPHYLTMYDDSDGDPLDAAKVFLLENWSALSYGTKEDVENLVDWDERRANLFNQADLAREEAKSVAATLEEN